MATDARACQDPAMLTVDRDLRFTRRQREVVRLITIGCSNLEIAERLGVSPRTAKAHSDVLRTKLGVSRRRQIPAAYREATGDDPFESLEAADALRGDSRTSH